MDAEHSHSSRPIGSEAKSPRRASNPHENENQKLFNSRIRPPVEPVRHEQTLVLVLYWEKGDLKVKPEVTSVCETFRNDYGFQVTEFPIQGDKPCGPTTEIGKAFQDLFYSTKFEHTLYIIYYAGHGWITSDRLNEEEQFKIGGTNKMRGKRNWKHNEVVWHQVEQQLSQREADVLVIFDCCYVGWLRENRRGTQDYSFEYIGACDRTEQAYGPHEDFSFTKALVVALKKLSDLEQGFSSKQLLDKAKEEQILLGAPVGELHPVIFPRKLPNRSQANVWIQPENRIISPGAQHKFREETADGKGEWETYYIRLSFNQKQIAKNIESLADDFNDFVAAHSGQGLRDVELLESPQDLRKAEHVVSRWLKHIQWRRSQAELQQDLDSLPLQFDRSTDTDSGVDVPRTDRLQIETSFCMLAETSIPVAASATLHTPELEISGTPLSTENEERPRKRQRTSPLP